MMAIMMIRYVIEKFPEKKRQAYLKGTAWRLSLNRAIAKRARR